MQKLQKPPIGKSSFESIRERNQEEMERYFCPLLTKIRKNMKKYEKYADTCRR